MYSVRSCVPPTGSLPGAAPSLWFVDEAVTLYSYGSMCSLWHVAIGGYCAIPESYDEQIMPWLEELEYDNYQSFTLVHYFDHAVPFALPDPIASAPYLLIHCLARKHADGRLPRSRAPLAAVHCIMYFPLLKFHLSPLIAS
ncbi:hypothetical protein RJT34_03421 [Clitoria ternatea]|uniref:Uncharacterized protein n=1 Tax=Clitoria ternatea TaxID=43366 RepID=A0AAN9KIY4_CLITE